MINLVPPEPKQQAPGALPAAPGDEAALSVLEDDLRVWLSTCTGLEMSGDPASRARLRIYVLRLKEMGYSPEAMIIHLKQLFPGVRRQRDETDARTAGALQEAVVRTCIEEYFGYRRV